MNYPIVRPSPSPYAQSNRQGQVSDPVTKILDVLAPLVKHITKPKETSSGHGQWANIGNTISQAQSNPATSMFSGLASGQSNAQNAYNTESGKGDAMLQQYIASLTAPRAAMPTQKPAMGGNESMGAGIVAALAAALGARPQFIQQGLQGYTGAREQNAQMNYANEVNQYNSGNDQRDRDLQGQQLNMQGQDRKTQLALSLLQEADGDIEKAQDLYRQYRDRSQQRKWGQEDKKAYDKTQTENNMLEFAGRNIKDTPSAKRYLSMLEKSGPVADEMRQAILEQGANGDRQEIQKGMTAAYKVNIKNRADAVRAAGLAGAKPGTSEYEGWMTVGKQAEDFYAQYHMTDTEKKEFWKYQNEARNADRFDLLHDKQAFDQWKLGQQQAGMNQRQQASIAAGQKGREFTQGEITKRSREADGRKVLKPYNDALGKMGFSPMVPVLPGAITSKGTAPIRRDSTGKPIQKPKASQLQQPKSQPKTQAKKVTPIKKGNTTVFDYSSKP